MVLVLVVALMTQTFSCVLELGGYPAARLSTQLTNLLVQSAVDVMIWVSQSGPSPGRSAFLSVNASLNLRASNQGSSGVTQAAKFAHFNIDYG